MRRTPLLAAGLGVPLSLALMVPGGALAVPEAGEVGHTNCDHQADHHQQVHAATR